MHESEMDKPILEEANDLISNCLLGFPKSFTIKDHSTINSSKINLFKNIENENVSANAINIENESTNKSSERSLLQSSENVSANAINIENESTNKNSKSSLFQNSKNVSANTIQIENDFTTLISDSSLPRNKENENVITNLFNTGNESTTNSFISQFLQHGNNENVSESTTDSMELVKIVADPEKKSQEKANDLLRSRRSFRLQGFSIDSCEINEMSYLHYPCSVCVESVAFSTQRSLTVHMKKNHPDYFKTMNENISCLSDISEKIAVTNNTKKTPNNCLQALFNSKHAQGHVKQMHSKKRKTIQQNFECFFCKNNVSFKSKHSLAQHMRLKHLYNPFFNPQKVQPENLRNQNITSEKLAENALILTQEKYLKNYKIYPKSVKTQCKKCGKTFSYKKNMLRHLQYPCKASKSKRVALFRKTNIKLTEQIQDANLQEKVVQNLQSKLEEPKIVILKESVKTSVQDSYLQNVFKLKEQPSEKTQCQKRGQTFVNQKAVKLINMTLAEDGIYKEPISSATICHLCGNIYETNLELKKHNHTSHLTQKIENVLQRGKSGKPKPKKVTFKINAIENKYLKHGYAREKKIMRPKGDTKCVCPFCKKILSRKYSLKRHLNCFHNTLNNNKIYVN